MSKKVLKAALLVLIVSAFCLASVYAAEEPFKIGSIFPLTGTVAKPGTGCARALELAFDEINQKGIYGKKLKLISEDDEGQPTVSVAAAEKLCVQDQVLAVIGPFNSSCALAHIQVTKREKVPQVVPVAFATAVTRPFDKANPWIFRNVTSSEVVGYLFANFIADESKGKKFVIFRENTDYGLDYERTIGGRLKARGSQIEILLYNPGDTDFYAHLTKIKKMKSDAVILISNITESSQIMKQAVDLGINVPFYATGSSSTQQFIGLAGKAGEGLYSLSFTEVMPNDPQIKKDFIVNYKKRFGVSPDMFAIATYDAAYIIAEGLKNVYKNNGNQFPKDLEKLRSKLREGISQINKFQLCQGKVVWNKYQEAATDVQFIQWKNGKSVIVRAIPADQCVLPGE